MDWVLNGALFFICAIGLISLLSLSGFEGSFFLRQLAWVLVGSVAFLFFSLLDYRIFRASGVFLLSCYLIGIAALFLLLAFGPTTRGIRGWFAAGSIAIQPVEFMKLLLILLIAKYFSKRHSEIAQMRHLVISGIYFAIPVLLVLLQPDLGSAFILLAIWVAVTLFSGIRLKHFLILMSLLVIISAIAWLFLLAPYQKARITAFLDPYQDPRGTGYNVIQSLIAVGSGQMWGKGFGYGSQTHLHFLPEAETDFIFAAFAEEWGFVGALVLLLLYGVLLWRLLRVGFFAKNNFARLYILGFSTLISTQIFIHIGMNVGIFPVTGITLPFMSYGGSSLVSLMAGAGIAQSIRIHS
ncbi:MAG: rod shape-determining protein RodA [bacterium]|nr:rod shape-determining protein RodA [bacterium]